MRQAKVGSLDVRGLESLSLFVIPLDDRREWFHARRAQSYPVLVAADDSGILGFASYGDFRTWPGYRFSVEHTVHIRADQRGRGVGTMLMHALVQRDRMRERYGQARCTLWTGDAGLAVYLWHCLDGTAAMPALDALD